MQDVMEGFPSINEAEQMLLEAESRNPGPWVSHSRFAANAAKNIARHVDGLDPETAYVLGLLHDIGRREGVYGMKHSIDGYRYAMDNGFGLVARICLTHVAFEHDNTYKIVGKWDGTDDDYEYVKTYLNTREENDYDRLIKLCDYISLPSGFCLLEKRIVDITLRSGFNELTLPRWKSTFKIKEYFENKMGKSIYEMLPGVVENTFEIEPVGELRIK